MKKHKLSVSLEPLKSKIKFFEPMKKHTSLKVGGPAEIYFQPFLKTKLKNRVSRYKTKEFRVVLSKDIPGQIYQITTYSNDTEDTDDITTEKLTFQGLKTNKQLRNEYKQKKKKGNL